MGNCGSEPSAPPPPSVAILLGGGVLDVDAWIAATTPSFAVHFTGDFALPTG